MNIFAKLEAGEVTRSALETQALAEALAGQLPPDTTLALHGNLGVGKTTFVQGLARGLGIQDLITSPTFTIFTLYRGPRQLIHLDAYRLESDQQIDTLMLEDFLVTPYCLAVEWPEKIAGWLPRETWHITLSIEEPGVHRVQLTSPSNSLA
jgi:tRNA threonylcarbamoyladenosine biosynthesis protein TsaE